MNTDTRDPLRLIQNGLDKLGHSPGAIDGLWGLRTARAMKALLAARAGWRLSESWGIPFWLDF